MHCKSVPAVSAAHEEFYQKNPPIPSRYLREMLSVTPKTRSNSMEKITSKPHGTAIGTKMVVAFANIFMVKLEVEIPRQSNKKAIVSMTSYLCGTQVETK